MKFEDVKKPPLTDINPNGRVPAIQDPNTNLTLWESGAIINYLIEKYDTNNKISYPSFNEKHLLNQWLMFQMSGQGPYWGTAGWFRVLHHEKLPSAIERYTEQVKRVFGVLDKWLEGKEWLVGDKMTYADMAWVPWNEHVHHSIGTEFENRFDGFPNLEAWHGRMAALPAWKKCNEIRRKLMAEQGLGWNGLPLGVETLTEFQNMMDKKDAETAPKEE
ncbi:glutathione S-transferase [Nemania sp. FL0031]|nr:glutathione S-transferase [Nemania sp. FL0031]